MSILIRYLTEVDYHPIGVTHSRHSASTLGVCWTAWHTKLISRNYQRNRKLAEITLVLMKDNYNNGSN